MLPNESSNRALMAGIAATSASLLMTELALTRIFSVTMFYHFAFLAISIALFGLSASGVFVYVARRRLAAFGTRNLLCAGALIHAFATLIALAFLVRMRIALTYSPYELPQLVAIYLLAALPFFAGGSILSVAFSRLAARINLLYGSDLLGAAAGCLALVPLMNWLGAPGAVLSAAGLSSTAALCFALPRARRRVAPAALVLLAVPALLRVSGLALFDVGDTKGHEGDRVLFSKWNSFSRVGVYDRAHPDWSLSPKFAADSVPSLVMDIDASASTPILNAANVEDAAYLRHELTAVAYHLVERPAGFDALVIGPGGGRDVLSALLFGARHVDGVEINPIIVKDVMLGRFREYSGNLYANPRFSIHVEDGRSFVRRSRRHYDVIQASLVDTWAATAAGAYTLTENSLYTVEAFDDYLDHLTEGGVLTVTRWAFDGLRLVSLAQQACERRGLEPTRRMAIMQYKNVMTFMLKRSPFSPEEVHQLQRVADELGFKLLYAPDAPAPSRLVDPFQMWQAHTHLADYRALILAPDRGSFIAGYPYDISATTDDRPFFFHTTRLRDQLRAAFGPSMLFGNGLSALLMLFGVSIVLVVLFVIGPLLIVEEHPASGWGAWLAYFSALGAGFMLFEVALLQRFVLLLGHPVYSLTVTLFSLLLGTGLGSLLSRRTSIDRVRSVTVAVLIVVAFAAGLAALLLARLVDFAIPWSLGARIGVASAVLVPLGVLLGFGLPGGMRLLERKAPHIIAWGWGMNGSFSVLGATLALFIAMNWGFSATLWAGAGMYLLAGAILATRHAL